MPVTITVTVAVADANLASELVKLIGEYIDERRCRQCEPDVHYDCWPAQTVVPRIETITQHRTKKGT